MNAIETEKRGPTQQIFHKVVEPSLGNLKLDFYPHHHSVRLHTAFYPQQSHCQLESESLESLPRPMTHPLVKQHGILPRISKKNAITKRSPSRSGSVGSVSQTKELPILTPRSVDRGSHLLNRNTKKATSVCSQYRYLGPSKALQSQSIGSLDKEELKKNEQVRRFEEEVKSLEHTRHLKRVSEIATYQHRVDRMYYMCGSKVPLCTKYSVDNEELEKLRAFSIARSQSRGSSARRSAAGRRIHDDRSSFVSGTDNQTDPGLTIDIVAGRVIQSPRSDRSGREGVSGDEGSTGAGGDSEDEAGEEVDTAGLKSPCGEAGTSDAMAAGLTSETSTDAHGETTKSADKSLHEQSETLKVDDGGAGDASCAHKTFVTEESFQETDLPQDHVNDATRLKNGSPQEQCSDNDVEAPENEGKLSADNGASSQEQEISEKLEEVNRTGGEQGDEDDGDGLTRDSRGHFEDGEEDDEEADVNGDSARAPLEDAEETNGAAEGSVSEKSGDKHGR